VSLKRSVQERLPAGWAARLGEVRRRANATVAGLLGGVLRALPLRLRALTKERFTSTGILDYPGDPIRLLVDSEPELARLHACRKEPETVAWIEQFVLPGEVVFDVGANVGAYSFVVDRATRGNCTVYAFEPSFSTFAQLSRNVALNGSQGRVIPVFLALSDLNGLETFNYSSLAPGAALHALGPSRDSKGQPFRPALSQPVLSYRLDDFVSHFAARMPNHIKLDVDGVELKVLRGASRTLPDRGLRTIMVEVEPTRPEFGAIQKLLTENGFVEHARYPHGPDGENAMNVLFTRGPKTALP
jgi:FkbM family methyltransferase